MLAEAPVLVLHAGTWRGLDKHVLVPQQTGAHDLAQGTDRGSRYKRECLVVQHSDCAEGRLRYSKHKNKQRL